MSELRTTVLYQKLSMKYKDPKYIAICDVGSGGLRAAARQQQVPEPLLSDRYGRMQVLVLGQLLALTPCALNKRKTDHVHVRDSLS